MGGTLLNGQILPHGGRKEMGGAFFSFFLVLDEVACHKDEWLPSPRMRGLLGWFNWVELNLSQVEMETERKSMPSIYKSL